MTVIKFLIKLPFKLLALPVALVIALLSLFGVFVVSFSSVIFNLFAGLCFLLAVACYLTGQADGAESLKMLIMGFVVFLLPITAEAICTGLAGISGRLWAFIRS